MTTNNLSVSRLINVSVILSPLAAQAQNLSTLLILGASDVIDVTERLRSYSSLAGVATDFGTAAVEYLAASLWFGQLPQPSNLKIGRWAQTAVAGLLRGATLSAAQQLIATWNLVTTPGFLVYLNGIPKAILPGSFAGATNLNGIAAIIQTALNTALAGTTCVWNSAYSRFTIESGTTGAGSAVSFLAPPTSVGFINFGSTNPANLATITLGGTVVTFVTGTPAGNQVKIGASLNATLQALLTFLQASVDSNLVKFKYSLDSTTAATTLELTAAVTGPTGDTLTIAASVATPSGATLSGGTATDISGMLAALSTSSGSYVAAGQAAESAATAAAYFDSTFGQTWYGLTMPTAVDADHLNVAAYIQGSTNKHIYGVSTQEAGVLVATSTTDIAYLLSQALYSRTVCQYSSSSPYSVCSLLGRILTVDYTGNSTTITVMFKQEPGIVPENIIEAQADALEAKFCNVFTAYDNQTYIIERGVMSSGDYIDVITGTDWLAVTIMTAVYNLLYTSPTKIPQTDAGNHLIVTTIEGVCAQGVANGLLAPGVWQSNGFGNINYGTFLDKGFYVYAPPIATQNVSDRAARKSVPIQVAAKLAGAVQTVSVTINVNR